MLLAGHAPGRYRVAVQDKNTRDLVGEAEYEVTDQWDGEQDGPPLWFSGSQPVLSTGSAWGGGDTDAPQNLDVFPARGTRQVAIVFVDTLSERYPSSPGEMQAHRDRWLDEVVRGVAGADGIPRSSSAWFREVSYGNFDLSARGVRTRPALRVLH
ncbi:hypothetical protein AB0I82_13835 [Streptomyces sp. NPDC050315]|uniref:hypothetical protein n=1 Tax=Streptomyces sp. NPDC050315 TaxID=3155039 RepID=UPI00341D16A4